MNDANSHDIRSEVPSRPPAEIQARPSVPPAHPPTRPPEYQFRKRRWKLWLSLAFLCVVLLGVVYSLIPPVDPRAAWPPLTAAEARQALVDFAASGDLELAQSGYGLGEIPEQPEEPEPWSKPDEVIFGSCLCNLKNRDFRFPWPPKGHRGTFSGSGLIGRFDYENGVWKAKLGWPGAGRSKQFKTWAG